MSGAEQQQDWTCQQCNQINASWATSCGCTATEAAEQAAFPKGFFVGQPRPKRDDPSVIARAVNKILPDVFAWLETSGHGWSRASEEEKKDIAHQVRSVVNGYDDGYVMAKELEGRFCWNSTSDLVEILDGLNFYSAEREAAIAWIKENSVAPKHEVGTEVSVKVSRVEGIHDGTITSIGEDGTYVINIPALGHVREGLGTHGVVLAWEVVEALNP